MYGGRWYEVFVLSFYAQLVNAYYMYNWSHCVSLTLYNCVGICLLNSPISILKRNMEVASQNNSRTKFNYLKEKNTYLIIFKRAPA